MRKVAVCYVPKRIKDDPQPWSSFGSTREEYERWIPHVCGVCCLKMVGDTLNQTNGLSLYQLTMTCLDQGAFRITNAGEIEGIFHYPLATVSEKLGIHCTVVKNLTDDEILSALSKHRFVMLSIDVAKVRPEMSGSHLILLHGYNGTEDEFLMHDCSAFVRSDGCNAYVSRSELNAISNKKGLLLG